MKKYGDIFLLFFYLYSVQALQLHYHLFFLYFLKYIFCLSGGFSLCPEILQNTQWLCLSSEFSTVRNAGFETETTASEV